MQEFASLGLGGLLGRCIFNSRDYLMPIRLECGGKETRYEFISKQHLQILTGVSYLVHQGKH